MLDNGVKIRFDGKGSEFASLHRELGNRYLMIDLDKLLVLMDDKEIFINGEDKVYAEYRHADNDDVIFKAIFELKKSNNLFTNNVLDTSSSITRALIALGAKLNTRFIVVLATNGNQPFYFYEYNFLSKSFDKVGKLEYETPSDAPFAICEFWKNTLKILP